MPHQATRADARAILHLLRERDFESSAALEKVSGLGRKRVSDALGFLGEKRLIQDRSRKARKNSFSTKALRLNASGGHVVGVDIGGTNLRVALADMRGTVLGKWCGSTKKASSPSKVIDQICKGVACLLQQSAVPRRSLMAVAAGAPGVTDGDAGVVLATSYLRGWKDVPFRTLLESALLIPAAVENDVRVGAIGERWQGAARGLKDFVFLAIGTGIAAGIFVNGQLVRGPDWAAGEIGYMLVPGTAAEAAESGVPGALENLIGGEGIRRQWLQSMDGEKVLLPKDLTATDIFNHARAGDLLAQSIVERTARTLAYAIYNISLVLNSSLFVLGGGVGVNATLLDATRRIIEPYSTPVRPKLALSSLGSEAQIVGTIRLALDQAEAHMGLTS